MPNEPKTTTERLTAILVEQLAVDAAIIRPEARFLEDLGADSLDTLEITIAVEDEFQINIDDEEVAKLATVGEVVAAIDERVAFVKGGKE